VFVNFDIEIFPPAFPFFSRFAGEGLAAPNYSFHARKNEEFLPLSDQKANSRPLPHGKELPFFA